jgi:hypothetical protein
LHNFAKRANKVSIAPRIDSGVLRDRFGTSPTIKIRKGNATVALEAYGYRWFGVEADG